MKSLRAVARLENFAQLFFLLDLFSSLVWVFKDKIAFSFFFLVVSTCVFRDHIPGGSSCGSQPVACARAVCQSKKWWSGGVERIKAKRKCGSH